MQRLAEKHNADVLEGSEEESILNILEQTDEFITVPYLTMRFSSYGGHPAFEGLTKYTTVRKIRQIIRDLREAGVPIVGNHKGIKIARSVDEIVEFCDILESKAKADIASMMKLRRKMLDLGGVGKASLFDDLDF